MITDSQQKTIDELQAIFAKINSLETPPSNLMEEIEAELNRATALKLKSEAALKAERSKAYAIMENYVASVYRPILNRFLPDMKVNIHGDGGFYLGESHTTFHIKSIIYEHKNEDTSKYYEHAGFQLDQGYKKSNITMSLSEMDEEFKKFVISVKKSIDKVYY